MFGNYLKTAWRSLFKHKAYAFINVLGLTLGIASCLVIFLVVRHELGYDKFHTKADRIYRVTLNAIDFNPCVSMAVAPALRNEFPELEQVSQVWYQHSGLVTVGKTKYEEKGFAFADQHFSSVFDYRWLEGDHRTALAEPNTIVLTESLAHKYFGANEAMGQVIKLQNTYSLKVTGIIQDVPGNTHLPFNFLVSFETVRRERTDAGALSSFYWISDGSFAYIVVPQNLDVKRIRNRMPLFIEKHWGKDIAKEARLLLQPLTDIHFDQRYLNNTISYTTSRETYYALAAVAGLIIIIACINFINLSTAQAVKRAKEVGVRKVLGSTRSQLIAQFLGETTLMVVTAVLSGLLITALFLPQAANRLGIPVNMGQLVQWPVILMILAITFLMIMLAGLYPAFVQSAFMPTAYLKGNRSVSNMGLTLRKGLVVVQFAISQIMIIGTLVIAFQMDFFKNRDLGFNKEAVISFSIPDQNKSGVLRQRLQEEAGIKEISLSSGAPVFNSYFTSFISPESGMTKDDVTEIKFIDERYTDMFMLKMLAGAPVKRTYASEDDTVYNVVVNETMIHKLGIQEARLAPGRQFTMNGNWHATITGVVQDFQSESRHKKIRPCVLLYRPDNFYMASVKLQPAGINKTIDNINKIWSGLFPEGLFSYEFIDDHIAAWYRQEQKEYTAFKLFSAVAILIGCLGLYGLVAFAAARRTKEVGIRKALGASVADIVFLFSKEFVVLIMIAFAIAAPLAFFIMHNWLHNFAYQINIGIPIFVISLLSSFAIAAGTITYRTIRAATINPVRSLRTE